jgi:DNA-binding transcriptional LysR family regulator
MHRTTRRVSLTEIGRDYYERCVQILQDLEEADQVAGARQTTPRGQLRVYCHQGIGRFVSPIVRGMIASGPAAPYRMWVSGEWFAQAGLVIRASLTSGANGHPQEGNRPRRISQNE